MKKYAMIFMGLEYNPDKDKTVFFTGDIETHILTVRNPDEALEISMKLKEEGFGAIEVCGAFGKELARRMYEATGYTVPVSYVCTPEDQIEQVKEFWGE